MVMNTTHIPYAQAAEIAQRTLGIRTLETRNCDALDFHDVSVGCILNALDQAFAAGRASANEPRDPDAIACPDCGVRFGLRSEP